MIRNVDQARKSFAIVIVCLLVICAGLLTFLLSPAVASGKTAQDQYRALNAELLRKRAQAVPALGMDEKLKEARGQISEFYKRDFPSRYSEISAALAKAAAESHVEVANVKYETKPIEGGGLAQVNLSLELGGGYENEIRFINALERSPLLLVIESVNQAEAQGGGVRLGVKLQTFMRTAES